MEVLKIDRNLHDKIFVHLSDWHNKNKENPEPHKFRFRLRRTNRYNRLQEGFWFHGTENYLLLSFWTGSDWKNRTPNISFLFTLDGAVCIELSGKDSDSKFEVIQKYFKPKLSLKKSNLLEDDDSYKSKIYIKKLPYKWNIENILDIVDQLIENEKNTLDLIFDSLIQESYYLDTAGLGYITSKEFDSLFFNIKNHRFNFENIVLGGTTVNNVATLINDDSTIKQKVKDYQGNIPIGLKELIISNYKQISNVSIKDIPDDTQWIFITGENGSGKTSILESIAISMIGNIEEGLVLNSADFSVSSKFYTPNGVIKNNLIWESNKYKTNRITPILNFACYGPNRFEISGTSTNSKINHSSKTYNLFNNDGNLLSIESEMLIWQLKGELFENNENMSLNLTSQKYYNQKYGNYHRFLIMYENTKDILIGLESNLPFPRKEVINNNKNNKGFLPNVYDMSFLKDKNDNVMYYHCDDNDKPLKFQELSTGNKSLLAMVGDLIVRFCKHYNNEENVDFSSFSGIVLIDEIDAHLHPQWQYEIPSLLSEAFPKIQFIVTCHSPIPLLGVPGSENRSIYLKTSKNEFGKISVNRLNIETSELTPNSIFSSPIFDFNNFLSKGYSYDKGFSIQDDYNNVLFEKMLQKKIEELDYEKSKKKSK